MSRLRASLASTPLDREVSSSLETARRSVLAALRSCEIQAKDRTSPQYRRVVAVKRDLLRVLGAMADVRRVSNGYAVEEIPSAVKKSKEETLPVPLPEVPPDVEDEESDE